MQQPIVKPPAHRLPTHHGELFISAANGHPEATSDCILAVPNVRIAAMAGGFYMQDYLTPSAARAMAVMLVDAANACDNLERVLS